MMRWPTWLRRRERHDEDREAAALAHAYLDGEMDSAGRAAVEASPEAQEALASARALKQLLSALPEEQAPRSFAITPEMLGQSARPPAAVPARAPLMRLSQMAAGIGVFGLMIVGVSALGTGSSDDGDHSAAGQQEELMSTMADEGTPAAIAGGAEDPSPSAGQVTGPAGEATRESAPPEDTAVESPANPDADAQRAADDGKSDFTTMAYESDEGDRSGRSWRTWSALLMGVVAIAGIAGWTVLARKETA